MTVGTAVFHFEVAFLDIAKVAEPEQKLTAQVCFYRVRGRSWFKVTQLEHFRLLRARRERPRRCAAEQRDELAALHSITSSASERSLSGIWRPRALTVFRLMTRRNLVCCGPGRSAGFAPLRIRPQ